MARQPRRPAPRTPAPAPHATDVPPPPDAPRPVAAPMPAQRELILGAAGGEAALELALVSVQLRRVATGHRPPLLRCYQPPATVAFSRRERALPGFARAVEAARRRGFEPVLRAAGGRVVAYHSGCLIVDEIGSSADALAELRPRFAQSAADHARALRELGVDARVGAVPGEYCPGEFSVNARGAVKLAGSAQRMVRGGWLLATVVVVRDTEPLRSVLAEVQAALGVRWDPYTVGAVEDEAPGVSVEDVQRVLVASHERSGGRLLPRALSRCELMLAGAQLPEHRLPAQDPA